MLEKQTAGENVASYCAKCKLALDHVIVAMEGETIAKVKCKTCGATHKYRDPAEAGKPRSSRSRQANAALAATALWETCLAEARGREKVYTMAGKYRVGDIVIHDKFGKGVVRKLYMNKCDVLFQDKERLMASGN